MADTRRGAQATDRHRRRQIQLAARADAEIRWAWTLLDLDDIDATRIIVDQQLLAIVQRYYRASQQMAAEYLEQYRRAELGTPAGTLVAPTLDATATVGVIDAAGPQALKRKIKQGVNPYGAYQYVRSPMAAEMRKMIMAGGRETVQGTGKADRRAVGWRRVSDGDPCTFCAMLVSRGPSYTSEALALTKDNGDPYHPNCGCTVEILYAPWEPTALEQRWVENYNDAAEAAEAEEGARTASDVLARMRANGTFRDSPSRYDTTPLH